MSPARCYPLPILVNIHADRGAVMKTFLKWALRIIGGLLGLAVIALLGLYLLSEPVINETFAVEGRNVAIPTDSASIERGRKISMTRGCQGCHQRDAGGQVFIDSLMLARVAAPNLTELVHERSIAELDRSIRHGVRADGKSVVIMPSGMLHGLSDEDFAALIAYLRILPRVERELPGRRFGPMARFGLLRGMFETERQQMAEFPAVTPSPDNPVAHGKYLATTTCTECHGPRLHGRPDFGMPDLVVAAAYTRENFIRLMRTGVSQDGSELELMAEVAKGRFSHFSDDELKAIHAYLSSPKFLASGRSR